MLPRFMLMSFGVLAAMGPKGEASGMAMGLMMVMAVLSAVATRSTYAGAPWVALAEPLATG